jgi:hypothetical protein
VIGITQRLITTRRGLNKTLQQSNWITVTVFLKVLEEQIWNLSLITNPAALQTPGNDANFSSPLQSLY